VPSRYSAGVEYVDARILPNVVYVARSYDLIVTQGRGAYPPSVSHGYGTSVDLVPAGTSWKRSAERLAADLGWTPGCGSVGERPACDLVPAILAVYYNGFPGHGDPEHCSGGCAPHIHVTWYGEMGPSDGQLHPPVPWLRVFPGPGVPVESST
jgi:hypothetical protein